MRKWMSDRLKRRKKEPQKAGTEPAPAPLQPAFYDVEPSPPEPPKEATSEASVSEQPESGEEVPVSAPEAAQPSQSGNGDGARRRRRRGRGGRSRARGGGAPA